MGYLGNQITTVFPTSISVDSATISGNASVGGTLGVTGATTLSNTLGVTGVSTLSDNIVFGASSKGVHLGVTTATASNLIDDYEEGTWTPSLHDGSTVITIASPNAHYTKAGNSVHAEFYLQRNDSASNTAPMILGGLPFAHKAIPAVVGQCWIDNSSSDIRCMLYLPSSYSQLYFIKTGGSASYVSFNEFGNSRYIYGAFDYLV
jgi:hypothetical protein